MKKILSFLLISGASYFGYSQCTTPIVAPWSDGFESFPSSGNIAATFNCWETVDAGPYWATDFNNTGSLNTGPLGPNSGIRYAYLETSTG
ncbi:MAG: hypothetical protein R3279_03535, partial [Putridiphycobacter sp.]|nr:hypothetical protein [Putridiphycobacter sp.]